MTVATIGEPGFTTDLTDQQAKGAGKQWMAASAAAAAVATIWSGADPALVDISYQVTGPIDGPSAGGILAVGTLAAIRDEALDPSVTMTGTIGPDGSIGPVGGVDVKLTAAAKAGFRTVLVPSLNMTQPGVRDQLLASAERLGLSVRPIRTLLEAYEAFTGVALGRADCVPAVAPAVAAAGLSAPTSSSTSGGSPVDPTELQSRADGVTRAVDDLVQATVLGNSARVDGLARNQLTAMPALLAPALQASALAQAAAAWAKDHPTDEAGLQVASRFVDFAGQQMDGEPSALAAWRALRPDAPASPERAARTAVAYAALLAAAGRASSEYLRSVGQVDLPSVDTYPLFAVPLAASMSLGAEPPEPGSTPGVRQAVLQTAQALAGWTLDVQLHSLAGTPSSVDDAEVSARTAMQLAYASACTAQSMGLDPSWPVWSVDTAIAAAESAGEPDREAAWLAATATAAAAQVSLAMEIVHPVS